MGGGAFCFDPWPPGDEKTEMIPLEDYSEDIVGKVMRGRGISEEQLCANAGITAAELQALLDGEALEDALRKVAPVLGLGAEQLVVCARKTWYPDQPGTLDGFAMANTTFHDMAVNAYVVWDPDTRKAVVFDSGADCEPLLEVIRKHDLTVELILLTHAHTDHVVDLEKLVGETGNPPVWINGLERDDEDFPDGAHTFDAGRGFSVDGLTIDTLLTSGHSAGGTTFLVGGLGQALAIIGDSLFAGSMGGSMTAYEEGRRNNIEKILPLAEDTILAPGHGPLTTVVQERAHNPFFTGT